MIAELEVKRANMASAIWKIDYNKRWLLFPRDQFPAGSCLVISSQGP